jgi:hypothetical protein
MSELRPDLKGLRPDQLMTASLAVDQETVKLVLGVLFHYDP